MLKADRVKRRKIQTVPLPIERHGVSITKEKGRHDIIADALRGLSRIPSCCKRRREVAERTRLITYVLEGNVGIGSRHVNTF